MFRKVACDWLRAKLQLVASWLPDAQTCPPGQVSDVPTSKCDMYPSGTFSKRNDSTLVLECVPCHPGHFCPEGATSPVQYSAPDAEVDDSVGVAPWPQAAWEATPDTLPRADCRRGLDSTPDANAIVDSAAGKASWSQAASQATPNDGPTAASSRNLASATGSGVEDSAGLAPWPQTPWKATPYYQPSVSCSSSRSSCSPDTAPGAETRVVSWQAQLPGLRHLGKPP